MANDLNQCNFIGRLGRDLETRTFPSGDQVANGTLAVGSKWKDKASGEARESTEWVRLTFHGKSAEIAAQYLRKGSQIFVSGEMQTRKWTDKEGVEKYSTEIRVNNFQMLGGKPGGTQQGNDGGQISRMVDERQQRPVSPPAPRASSGFEDMGDDEIPFRDPLAYRGAYLVL